MEQNVSNPNPNFKREIRDLKYPGFVMDLVFEWLVIVYPMEQIYQKWGRFIQNLKDLA